jgi:predicted nucleotidyltransferase
MLKYLITSKAKRNILKLFITNPDKSFYTREIAKLTGEPLSAVRRELGYLETAGLLRSRRNGNLKYYSVVKEFPFFPELKRIIYGTIGIGDYLSQAFSGPDQVELAFIYGSVASNTEKSSSDIDLFVVGDIDYDRLHELVIEAETDIGRTINFTLISRKEFNERVDRGEPFVKRIMAEEKIVLKGTPDDY